MNRRESIAAMVAVASCGAVPPDETELIRDREYMVGIKSQSWPGCYYRSRNKRICGNGMYWHCKSSVDTRFRWHDWHNVGVPEYMGQVKTIEEGGNKLGPSAGTYKYTARDIRELSWVFEDYSKCPSHASRWFSPAYDGDGIHMWKGGKLCFFRAVARTFPPD